MRKSLYYRCLALFIYEFLQDIQNRLGKDFYEIIDKLNLKTEHRKTYKKTRKTLSQIYKKHSKHLSQIRNTVVAHREIDAKEQIAVIDKLKGIEIAKVGNEINNWFVSFLFFWSEIYPVLQNKLKEIAVRRRS